MDKKARIGLIVFLTVILLLAAVTPGMAKKDGTTCSVPALTVDRNGNYRMNKQVPGELHIVVGDFIWINDCTGSIPFGGPIGGGGRYADFYEGCAYFSEIGECGPDYYVVPTEYVENNPRVIVPGEHNFPALMSRYQVNIGGTFSYRKEFWLPF